MKSFIFVAFIFHLSYGAPSVRIYPNNLPSQLMNLPSNATSIRLNIKDGFSCIGRDYGYYADMDNDCQIFHVCLPVSYAGGKKQTFRWSFICPDNTMFNQEIFTCVSPDESISCVDSSKYYRLNSNLGENNIDLRGDKLSNDLSQESVTQINLNKLENYSIHDTRRKLLD